MDVITFGEAMIRLTPPDFKRIEQTDQFEANPGGAELNVAVGLSQLGCQSQWISKLPDNGPGRLIIGQAQAMGVDVHSVIMEKTGRVGLYYYEKGSAPRPSSVLYDRTGSCFAHSVRKDYDYTKVKRAKWFHTSGITPGLSSTCAEATLEFLKQAKLAKLTTSYDLNFRKKLWSEKKAQQIQQPMMEYVDILISTEEDIERVFKIKSSPNDYLKICEELKEKFNFKLIAITIRDNISVWKNRWSAVLFNAEKNQLLNSRQYEVEIVDRIGAGDSFSAGLIYSLLLKKSYQTALDFAVAFSALKHTIPGDFNLATREEVERLLNSSNLRVQR